MDIKIDAAKKIKVQIGEAIYEVYKPKMSHQLKLESEIKKAQDSNSSMLEPMIDYVASLGMPKEVIMDLDQDDFTVLVEKLSASKKN